MFDVQAAWRAVESAGYGRAAHAVHGAGDDRDALLFLLERLDARLARAVDLAQAAFGGGGAAETFTGLTARCGETAAAMAREPGEPFLSTEVDDAGELEEAGPLALRRWRWAIRLASRRCRWRRR